jgi:serine/threonine protein kinase
LDNVCTLSPDTCSKIENGIAHLHSLGLVHNDLNPLNPANIMFSEDDIPVIIDFDSCRREGENLLKAGTPGWSDESAIVADRANDYYGLKKIKEAISGLQNGNKTAG